MPYGSNIFEIKRSCGKFSNTTNPNPNPISPQESKEEILQPEKFMEFGDLPKVNLE